MTDTVVVLIRSLAAYITLFLLARMMGKQVIAQVTFFEFVVGIMIGDIAATMAMDIHSVSFAEGLVAMLVMAGITVVLSALQLKNPRLRTILEGSPTVLIQDGKILTENLYKERFTLQDLQSQLRLQQVFSIDEVQTAILEPNGHVSVKLKKNYESLRWGDLASHPAFGVNVLRNSRVKRILRDLMQAEIALEILAATAGANAELFGEMTAKVSSIRADIAGRFG